MQRFDVPLFLLPYNIATEITAWMDSEAVGTHETAT